MAYFYDCEYKSFRDIITNFNISLTTINSKCSQLQTPTKMFILKNSIGVWFAMIIGAFTFGISSFLNLAYNSIAFGNLLGLSVLYNGLNSFIFVVLPHGIFEIPAIIIAGAAGV